MKLNVREHLYEYMAKNHDIDHKGQVATKMGIRPQELSSYFSGSRMLSDNTLNQIAKFFELKFEAVKNEHIFYVNKKITQWEGSHGSKES